MEGKVKRGLLLLVPTVTLTVVTLVSVKLSNNTTANNGVVESNGATEPNGTVHLNGTMSCDDWSEFATAEFLVNVDNIAQAVSDGSNRTFTLDERRSLEITNGDIWLIQDNQRTHLSWEEYIQMRKFFDDNCIIV